MDADIPVFIKPLQVEIDGMGRYRKAETVNQLAGMLLSSKWHHRGSTQFHSALMRSVEALEFYTEAETARAAFVEVLMKPVCTFFLMTWRS